MIKSDFMDSYNGRRKKGDNFGCTTNRARRLVSDQNFSSERIPLFLLYLDLNLEALQTCTHASVSVFVFKPRIDWHRINRKIQL